MKDNNVEKWILEDGRKAEKTVQENQIGENECERVTEIKMEEERPLKVQQRIVEKVKPFVYERRIETIDSKTGEVIDQKVEAIDVSIQSNASNEYVTKQEMIEAIVTAMKSTRKEDCSKLNSLGIADSIANKIEPTKYSQKDILLIVIILAQIFGLAYLLLWN